MTIDEKKIKKLEDLFKLINADYVSHSDLKIILDELSKRFKALIKDVEKDGNKVSPAITFRLSSIDKKITQCLDNISNVNNNLDQKFSEEIQQIKEDIDNIELMPGVKGEDAEFTEEIKKEIVSKVLISLKDKLTPELESQIKKIVDEALKNRPNMTIINNDGGIAAPFELPIKAGTNINVSKDASGAYVITNTGGSGGGLTKETPVGTIDDSNLIFTVSNEPFFINVNGAIYNVGDGAYASYLAGTITLNYPVGTGGFIKSYY